MLAGAVGYASAYLAYPVDPPLAPASIQNQLHSKFNAILCSIEPYPPHPLPPLPRHDTHMATPPNSCRGLTVATGNSYFSVCAKTHTKMRIPSEKYFFDGIRIFVCVFAHTEKSEIPVVWVSASVSCMT